MTTPTTRFPFTPTQPGAYSTIDSSALAAAAGAHGPVVAIVGPSRGGQPNTPLYFSDAGALRSRLRGGDGYDTARLALAGGGQPVCFVRPGTGISQATITLAATTGAPVVVTSNEYGLVANQIKLAVAANNTITLTFTDPDTGQSYVETFTPGASATCQKILDTINGKLPGVPGSAFATATTTGTASQATTLTAASATAMTGGSDGSGLTTSDYTTGLAALESEDVAFVVAATSDATVHAQAKAHCDAMSSTQTRQERRMLFGAALAESVANAVARAASLQSSRAQIVYPGIKMYDTTGNLVVYPGYIAAGYVAGMAAALPDPATPMVHARLDIIDVETRLSAIGGGAIDQLLAGNVSPITAARGGGFWLVDSLSTSTDPNLRDFHKQGAVDASVRRLRDRLEAEFVGGKTITATAGQIEIVGNVELDDQVREELLWAHQPLTAIRDTQNPRAFQITAPILPPEATKYLLITVPLQPPSTAGAAANIPTDALA